ncbi:MAG: rod shape-determining protein MreD [Candidatus Omnitrophota bacterium]|nr:rod shape-determining protein MreD [Candidatus Omnitrophota bacterium]
MSGIKKIAFILVILIFLLLEVVYLDKIEIHGIKPDLLLIALIFFSLQRNLIFGLGLGLVLGLLKGVFSAGPLGIQMFTFGLCGLVIGKYFKFIYKQGIFVKIVTVFFLSIFAGLVYYLASLPIDVLPNLVTSFRGIILPAGIYTAIFALPAFLLLQKLFYENK